VPVTDTIVSENTSVTVAFELNALVDLQAKVKTGLFKKLKLARLQAAYETFCAAHGGGHEVAPPCSVGVQRRRAPPHTSRQPTAR
jgi:hypothetical protein